MPDRRTGLLWAVIALVAALLTGCLRSEDDTLDDQTVTTLPDVETVLRVSVADWPDCLNPILCRDSDAAHDLVFQHVLPQLMERVGTGVYAPSPLLDGPPEVTVAADGGGQTITYRLAPDARWHDGRPITSSDIHGTWRAWVASRAAGGTLYERITGVDDSDPLVAVVTLDSVRADWPELFGGTRGYVLEADLLGPTTDVRGEFEEELPFGAGPYRLEGVAERQLSLIAVPDHWAAGPEPGFDEISVRWVPDMVDGIGSVDASVVLTGDAPPEPAPEGWAAVSVPRPSVIGVFFDQRAGLLAQRQVREALTAAVGRRQLADRFPGGASSTLVRCLGFLPDDPACASDFVTQAGNLELADRLLATAGFERSEDGGRRPVDAPDGGPPLSLSVTYDPRLPLADAVADAVAATLGDLGITTQVRAVGDRDWRDPGRAESTGIGIFAPELGTIRNVAALYRCSGGIRNPLGWCNQAQLDELSAFVHSVTDAERNTHARELSARAQRAAAWVPLLQGTTMGYVEREAVDWPGFGTGLWPTSGLVDAQPVSG